MVVFVKGQRLGERWRGERVSERLTLIMMRQDGHFTEN
jgi:hypothetical protein